MITEQPVARDWTKMTAAAQRRVFGCVPFGRRAFMVTMGGYLVRVRNGLDINGMPRFRYVFVSQAEVEKGGRQ
jgi:hypothetical protein